MQCFLKETHNIASFHVDIDIEKAGSCGQARHCAHGTNERVEETSANTGANVTHGQSEAGGHTDELGIVGEREMGLSHAERKRGESLSSVLFDARLSLLAVADTGGTVDACGDLVHLLLDGQLQRVEELKVGLGLTGSHQRLCQIHHTSTALGPVLTAVGTHGTCLGGVLTNQRDLGIAVAAEAVHSHQHFDTEQTQVLDVLGEVGATVAHQIQVLIGVGGGQRRTRHHARSTTVHLERTHSHHQHGSVWHQTTVATLDIEELFGSDVSTETSLRHHEAIFTNQLESNLVRQNRTVSMSNVGKRSSVHKHWSTFESLHQVWHDGILHEHSECTGHTQIITRDRFTGTTASNHHGAETFAHIHQGGSQRKHSHDFTGNSNVKVGFTGVTGFRRTLTDGDLAQETIVGIHNTLPGDSLRIEIQTNKLGNLLRSEVIRVGLVNAELGQTFEHDRRKGARTIFGTRAEATKEGLILLSALVEHACIDRSRNQVVCSGDGVNITGQMEIEVFHWDNLRVTSTSSTTLDTKRWALAGLTKTGERGAVQMRTETLHQTNQSSALTLTKRCRVDASHHNVLAVGTVTETVEHVQ
mmetsp:Transcript_48218/g.121354  ORF Transcript_48218/g.121354 Transcript_48218/m.121354 type:complete len:586 (+) Transcript_48218:36-1793(+)